MEQKAANRMDMESYVFEIDKQTSYYKNELTYLFAEQFQSQPDTDIKFVVVTVQKESLKVDGPNTPEMEDMCLYDNNKQMEFMNVCNDNFMDLCSKV